MNTKIQIQVKYLLLLILAVFVLLYLQFFNNNTPPDKVEITKTTTIKEVEKIDSAKVDLSTLKPEKKQLFLVDSITKKARKKPLKKDTATAKKPTEKEVEARVFKKNVQLENSNVAFSIFSPCDIYGIDFKVFNKDKYITNTIKQKTTKYIVPNVWFLNYEPKFTLFPSPQLIGHEISIDYTIKNKIRFGVGVEYNNLLPTNNNVFFNFKIGLQL